MFKHIMKSKNYVKWKFCTENFGKKQWIRNIHFNVIFFFSLEIVSHRICDLILNVIQITGSIEVKSKEISNRISIGVQTFYAPKREMNKKKRVIIIIATEELKQL